MSLKNILFGTTSKARHVYLNNAPGSKVFHYRGVVGPNDDVESFTVKMAKKGHAVIVTDRFFGRKIDDKAETLEL